MHLTAVIGQTACAASEIKQGQFDNCTGNGPAATAGIRAGDVVVKVGDTPVADFSDMAAAVQKLHGTVPVVIKRDGQTMTKHVDIAQRQRWVTDGKGSPKQATIGVMGVVGSRDAAVAVGSRAKSRPAATRRTRLRRACDRYSAEP